ARSAGELDLQVIRIEKAADAAHDLDLARLGHAGEPAGELLDHAFLEAAQLVDVDLRRAEGDAMRTHVLHFIHHCGCVQQRLRRNAADVEAYTAQRRVALDKHRLHPKVGRTKRSGIST